MKILGRGAVGVVVTDFNSAYFNFCLKIVKRSPHASEAMRFWRAAKAIQLWTADMRYHAGFTKVPLAVQYWILDPARRFDTVRLNRLIRHHEPSGCAIPSELTLADPEEYALCPDEKLAQIYGSDRRREFSQEELLLTYPVQKGGTTIAQYLRNGGRFEEQELLDCCYQILSSIHYLYTRNAAHCDIKPANILIHESGEKKVFQLTDFDACFFMENPSDAGTEAFLPERMLQEELKEEYSRLEFRVLLDCFALAQSISCMSAGTELPPEAFPHPIPEVIRKLYRIGSFQPSQIRSLLTDLETEYGCRPHPFQYFPVSGETFFFDEMDCCPLGDLGTFHEQLRFSRRIDPLLAVKGGHRDTIPEFFEFFLIPLGSDRYHTFYHAPDDAVTGCRPSDFRFYEPKSLINTVPSPDERQRLVSCGRLLNEFLKSHSGTPCFLPGKEHVVWVDGELRIGWNMGQRVPAPTDYEKYFSFLASGDAGFLMNLFDEGRPHHDWLFGIAEFREMAMGRAAELTVEQWRKIRRHTKRMDDKIPLTVKWELLLTAGGREVGEMLAVPAFAGLPETPPPGMTDAGEKVRLFIRMRRQGKQAFRQWFPPAEHRVLTAQQWGKLLCFEPGILEFVPKEMLPFLPRESWLRLLGRCPEMAETCPYLLKFSSGEWVSLLRQQPGLKDLCPPQTVFSEAEKKRLQKNRESLLTFT